MNFNELKQILKQSDNIVFFGGAGTSTESGIPDFRSTDGLYNSSNGGKYAPEEILSRDFFLKHTKEFYEFYRKQMIYPSALPNPAHNALFELERNGQLKAVITQNIDGLHQNAGSTNVLELHGTVHKNHCVKCGHFYPLDYILAFIEVVPACEKCGGVVKPDVVLYQESLDMDLLQMAASYIQQADVLIVAGTSLTVQPAAGLIRSYEGSKFILINKSSTPLDGMANYIIPDSIAKVLKQLVS
jgi:NAD-dependent deacetylase